MATNKPQGVTVMSAGAILEMLRAALATTDERLMPAERDLVYASLLAHIRARRPESVSPLGTLPPPAEVIRDPRGDR